MLEALKNPRSYLDQGGALRRVGAAERLWWQFQSEQWLLRVTRATLQILARNI